jgi:hypothetical protein
MVRLISVISFLVLSTGLCWSQCTISCGATPCTVQWSNAGPTCADGGTIIIPAGVTLEFDGVADTWTGTTIEVYGRLWISADVTINSSLIIRNGGLGSIDKKLSLGTSPTNPSGCGYTVNIQSGGSVDIAETGTDRLNVCGTVLMKGNGACNSCGGTNSGTCAYNGDPYCEPNSGSFTGPLGYDQTGNNQALPVELLYFDVKAEGSKVNLKWATEVEENFDHFEVQRAGKDLVFTSIITIEGAGYNTSSIQEYATSDQNPLVGTGYYRLKAVDIDGSVEYFYVRSVTYNGGRNFFVSPNPTSGSSINYNINFDPSPYDRVVLIDAVGNELLSGAVTGSKNELIPNKTLPPGAYLLRYVSANYQQVARVFIKE